MLTSVKTALRNADIVTVVVGWLTRVVLLLVLLGVVGFDAIAIGVGHFDGSDDGTNAAQDAATSWQQTHNLAAAQAAAVKDLGSSETLVPGSFSINASGIASLTIRLKVTTLVAKELPGLKKLTTVTIHSSSGPSVL